MRAFEHLGYALFHARHAVAFVPLALLLLVLVAR